MTTTERSELKKELESIDIKLVNMPTDQYGNHVDRELGAKLTQRAEELEFILYQK